MVEEAQVNNVYDLKAYRILQYLKYFIERDGFKCRLSVKDPLVLNWIDSYNKRKVTLVELYAGISALAINKNSIISR
jgi:hypothetical protein